MHHHLTGFIATALLFATAPYVLADTTIIHAGELLAVPGLDTKLRQTIVIVDDRIIEIRNGFIYPFFIYCSAFIII